MLVINQNQTIRSDCRIILRLKEGETRLLPKLPYGNPGGSPIGSSGFEISVPPVSSISSDDTLSSGSKTPQDENNINTIIRSRYRIVPPSVVTHRKFAHNIYIVCHNTSIHKIRKSHSPRRILFIIRMFPQLST